MKKLLIAVAAVLMAAATYAQGTLGAVTFGNLGGGVNAPVLLGALAHYGTRAALPPQLCNLHALRLG